MNSQGQFYNQNQVNNGGEIIGDEHKENQNNIYATEDKRMSRSVRDKSENNVITGNSTKNNSSTSRKDLANNTTKPAKAFR